MWSRLAPVPFQYSYWRSLRIPGTSKYEWPPGQMYCRLWDIYPKLSWPQFWSHFQSFVISGHSMNLKTWLIIDCPWINCSSFVASFFPFYLFIYFFMFLPWPSHVVARWFLVFLCSEQSCEDSRIQWRERDCARGKRREAWVHVSIASTTCIQAKRRDNISGEQTVLIL